MEKIKTFFSKFKGYMLTIALAVLTVVEMCGGFINSAFGGVLTIKGVEVLPVVTLICTAVVGVLSNGYTKEQRENIKNLLNASNANNTNELVVEEIKKTLNTNKTERTKYNRELTQLDTDVANYESELEKLTNVLKAKKEMFSMIPQLATEEDIKIAANAVNECRNKLNEKIAERAKVKTEIENLTTTINALKSQL